MEKDAAQQFPAFFYHLGDVVYYDGEHGSYYPQFYEPYLHYPAPIFAIPGNHDTDVGVPPNHASPEPFMANFCDKKPEHSPDAHDIERTTMIQPNCYWTLNTPLATIVGLATNAPDHGVVKADQAKWLVGELKAAPHDQALVVALHHPPLSADGHHGASVAMREMLDKAFADAGRVPDIVLSGTSTTTNASSGLSTTARHSPTSLRAPAATRTCTRSRRSAAQRRPCLGPTRSPAGHWPTTPRSTDTDSCASPSQRAASTASTRPFPAPRNPGP
jgi:hypothetical protein